MSGAQSDKSTTRDTFCGSERTGHAGTPAGPPTPDQSAGRRAGEQASASRKRSEPRRENDDDEGEVGVGAAHAVDDAEGADDAADARGVAQVESKARTARAWPTADSLTAWAKARRSASGSTKGAPRRWLQCNR